MQAKKLMLCFLSRQYNFSQAYALGHALLDDFVVVNCVCM